MVSGIKGHLNADGSRVSASEKRVRVALSEQLGQRIDPLVAQRAVVVPRQVQPHQRGSRVMEACEVVIDRGGGARHTL